MGPTEGFLRRRQATGSSWGMAGRLTGGEWANLPPIFPERCDTSIPTCFEGGGLGGRRRGATADSPPSRDSGARRSYATQPRQLSSSRIPRLLFLPFISPIIPTHEHCERRAPLLAQRQSLLDTGFTPTASPLRLPDVRIPPSPFCTHPTAFSPAPPPLQARIPNLNPDTTTHIATTQYRPTSPPIGRPRTRTGFARARTGCGVGASSRCFCGAAGEAKLR